MTNKAIREMYLGTIKALFCLCGLDDSPNQQTHIVELIQSNLEQPVNEAAEMDRKEEGEAFIQNSSI